MARHEFNTMRPRLEIAINRIITQPTFSPKDPRGFSLIPGFIQAPLQNAMGNDAGFAITGSSVPLVGIIGNSTGQIVYFAVSVLLPDVRF